MKNGNRWISVRQRSRNLRERKGGGDEEEEERKHKIWNVNVGGGRYQKNLAL